MDTIINIQNENVDDLTKLLRTMVKKLPLITKMSKSSQNNIISKIRFLNKSIELISDDVYDILNDFKKGGCKLNHDLEKKLEQEDRVNQNIKKITPLILSYMIYNNDDFN